jgi:hypothetical protein
MKILRTVSLAALLPGRPQSTLTEAQVECIKAFRQTFAEVLPGELEEVLESFRRDQDPEREILVWEAMAEDYKRKAEGKSLAQRKALFGKILQASLEQSPLVVAPASN